MEKNKYKLGFVNYFIVDNEGRSGGIALMWGLDLELSFLTIQRIIYMLPLPKIVMRKTIGISLGSMDIRYLE